MLAPHAVDIAATISSLIASLCFTFAVRRHFSLRQVKLCIGQRKYKQKLRSKDRRPTDRPSEWIRAHSLNSYFAFCKIVVKMKHFKTSFTVFHDTDLPNNYSPEMLLTAKSLLLSIWTTNFSVMAMTSAAESFPLYWISLYIWIKIGKQLIDKLSRATPFWKGCDSNALLLPC